MTVTAASFRQTYPEFADVVRYPASQVAYYLALAGKMIDNGARWGDLEDDGRMLFIAHHVVLERKAMEAADQGNVPGVSVGVVNSKSVDKVSVGYDTSAGTVKDAGHWNLTVYGIRLKQLMDMMGAGPIAVGVSAGCLGPNSSSTAWPGPWQSLFPNPSD